MNVFIFHWIRKKYMWCESIILLGNNKLNEILAIKCFIDFYYLQPHLIDALTIYFIELLMARHHSQDKCICALNHLELLEIIMARKFGWITRVEVNFIIFIPVCFINLFEF